MSFEFEKGEILLVGKPYSWTSFDVVGKIRSLIRRYSGLKKVKIGHAGTLDPLATGLLILCTGKFTKRIEEFQELDKEYTGTFKLGTTSPPSLPRPRLFYAGNRWDQTLWRGFVRPYLKDSPATEKDRVA